MWRFVALFVLFSVLFGVNVNAASTLEHDLYSIDSDDYAGNLRLSHGVLSHYNGSANWLINTDDLLFQPSLNKFWFSQIYNFENFKHQHYYWFDLVDGSPILEKSDSFTLSLSGLYSSIHVQNQSNVTEHYYYLNSSNISDNVLIEMFFVDGTSAVLSADDFEFSVSSDGFTYSLVANFSGINRDVSKFCVTFNINNDKYSSLNSYDNTKLYYIYSGFNNLKLSINVSDKTEGLLGSVIAWLTSIRDNIVGLFDKMVEGFSAVVTVITELPGQIWDYIETGLKNLFVPTQEDLQEYHDKWDMLFADRFGALYEVVEIVKNFIGSFESYNETGTILFPAVTVDLAGSPFTFGGWTVPIVPAGLEFLFDAVKLAIDMVATYAFVFGMKRRYEELVERG